VYPVIEAVSHHEGSLAGGLLLTVTGKAFDPTAEANVVDIDGVPCAVLSATNTQLVCRTGEAAGAPAVCAEAADCESAAAEAWLCVEGLCTAAVVVNGTLVNGTLVNGTLTAAATEGEFPG
jgi:hypothetical protein